MIRHRLMRVVLAIAVGTMFPALTAGAQSDTALLRNADLQLVRVVFADGAYEYHYRAVNPPGSTAGIELVGVDLSAPRGTGFELLSGSDRLSRVASAPHSVELTDHVPLAVKSPGGWQAFIGVKGAAEWWSATGGVTMDSLVRPGTQLAGFVVRSTWLPGPRAYWMHPDWAICCSEPRDTIDDEHPRPADFRLTGTTIGPAVAPVALTLRMLREQLDFSCESGWISHHGICRSLAAKLAHAEALQGRGQTAQSRSVLRAFVAELDAQHGPEPGKHVSDAAFAMLTTNAQVLLDRR